MKRYSVEELEEILESKEFDDFLKTESLDYATQDEGELLIRFLEKRGSEKK